MAEKSGPQILSVRQHVVYICSRLLAYGLPLLYFLVTTSFYLKTYDSAQVKITFVQIGVSLLLFIWFVKILVEGHFPFKRSDLVFVAPFFAWFLSGLISFAYAPYKLWPMEEALRRFFYIILALIVIAEFRSEERMARLWRWLFAAALVSVGYGVIQYIDKRFFLGQPAGVDPFIWRGAFGYRVFSTFGNPNFYGNFLVIITPLILATVIKQKGSLMRPFLLAVVTIGIVLLIDKMNLKILGSFDPSLRLVFNAAILFLLMCFVFLCVYKVPRGGGTVFFMVLFALIVLNLYATETKGAWLGFIAAVSVTCWLIFEFFLHTEDQVIDSKKYGAFFWALTAAFVIMIGAMAKAFVVPLFKGEIEQIGFSILWIPVAISGVIVAFLLLWMAKKPWNLKKMIYGLLVLFVLSIGGGVLAFAKTRLTSVSFRLFTWISTWEMIRTAPVIGNGVGSFKVIYPAYRRPQIIVLEAKSNTETDHSEDEYLEVWQDEGIVGFGIFIWLILTAIVCGMKQLRWYANIRAPDKKRSRKTLDLEQKDPRSYEVLGILGAYVGALIHWSVDVSVRFVSSGIFSGLLPGLLVAYARNHAEPVRVEARLPYDRWIRVGLAGLWTAVFLVLKMELVPESLIQGGDTTNGQIVFFCLLAGAGLYVLIELLDWGLSPSRKVPIQEQYPAPRSRGLIARFAGIFVLGFFLTKGLKAFINYFEADVHHNLAIFFSKQGVWRKSPEFRGTIRKLPPDIQKRYFNVGGALEHYHQVIQKNPGFPMARYFTGNVYNDWGSQMFNKAMTERRNGNAAESRRLKDLAFEKWDLSEKAYEGTKTLGPNYVQVHHQTGLLNLKRAQASAQWGNPAAARRYYDAALHYFYLYRMIDPVFPPNYHRLAEILLTQNRHAEAIRLYEEAIYYNDVMSRGIHPRGFPDRVADLAVNLARVAYNLAEKNHKNPFRPVSPEMQKAIKYFELAIERKPNFVDAYKGLSQIRNQMGQRREAESLLRRAFKANPNDPELKRIFGRS